MDSKERVKTTLAHEIPDRLPVNFRAVGAVCNKLQKRFDVDYEGLLQHFNVDFREVNPPYIGPEFPDKDGAEIDIWGVGRSVVQHEDGGRDVMVTYNPLAEAETAEHVAGHNWPKASWFDYSAVPDLCRGHKGYALSSNGIHSEGWHGIFHLLTYLFGMEKGIMYLVARPDLVEVAITKIMEFQVEYYSALFEAGKGQYDLLFYKDDFGSQNNLLISQKMFRDFFLPHTKTLCDLAKNYDVSFIQHSCGAVYKIIPDFIEAGVEVLDPIQVTAKGMDVVELKKNFGADLVFHGGIDTQKLLPFGSAEEVKSETRRIIEVLGEDGGYFFSPAHRIQADTPDENILAMYEALEGF